MAGTPHGGRGPAIALIAFCQVACMTLWFSASAVVPGLLARGLLEPSRAALLTAAVQLGFVAGTMASAALGLADRGDPRRLFMACGLFGAAANAALLLSGFDTPAAVALRFLTGMALAGVYPVGMKLAAGWAGRRMGLMMGLLVGALTLGSALPHLFNAFSSLDSRYVILGASACTLAGAIAVRALQLGPDHRRAPAFRPGQALAALRSPALRYVNGGYLGHMWELYAMWAWMGSFLAWALPKAGATGWMANASLVTFAVVAAGAAGCVAAGLLADRYGRTAVTCGAMAASGLCALAIGPAVAAGPAVLAGVAIAWGVSVIADSAQFSAALAELAEAPLVGTLLTLQTSLGFLLTFFAIQAVPIAQRLLGWEHAFAVLAIGPALGILSMWRLRALPEAARLAGGRR